jgi:hypothetical protein
MSGGQYILEEDVLPIGSRVCVANEGSYRGCKGTIVAIHMIATPGKPTSCSYLVVLDGANLREPLWFESHEVALVGTTCEKPAECEALKS